MASVQPAAMAGMSIPPGFGPVQAREAYAKYTAMKQNGVPADNPEMIKLHTILAAVQKAAAMAKQTNQARQQQQQNGAMAQPNGTNGAMPQSSPSNLSTSQSATPAPANSQPRASKDAMAPSQPNATQKTVGNGVLNPEQLAVLRAQIHAFKHLSKNLGVPPTTQRQLFGALQGTLPASATDAMTTAGRTIEKSSKDGVEVGRDDGADSTKRPSGHKTFTSPYTHLGPVNYYDHSFRQKRLMIPSIMPTGVDVDRLREDRERIIYNRMMARKAELESLPANITSWDAKKTNSPSFDDSLKLKALIEYKKLCLLPKQRELRNSISLEILQYDNLAITANRGNYRRMKKQSLREARMTERLEQEQRVQRVSRENAKQREFLQTVVNRSQEVAQATRSQKERSGKLGRLMQQHHQNIEKEEQKRIERMAKVRLAVLKANDEDAYMKLLDQAKDTRISHLVRQTNGFLKQLAASVKAQQRSAAEHYGAEEDDDDEDDDDDDDDDDEDGGSRKNIDYYAVAHRIKEEVNAQPDILVGGTLKEYQVKGLQWMISLYNNNLNGILADEMGLGKTIQTISLITHLIEKKRQNGPFLVIVPLSTLTNWNLEFEKWAPSVKRIVYKGPPLARKQQQQQIRMGNWQVLLTTYEYIIKDRPVLSKIKWIHMIVDEGHRMKNAQSKLSNTLTQYYTTRYRLILTGTPLQNNLPELWALLNFVLPTIFKSVKSFDEWFNTPFANTGGQDKMELTEEEQLLVIRRLHKVLRPFLLRRLKKDVEKDLPDKQETVIKCKFSALQTRLYKQLGDHQKLFVQNPEAGKKSGLRGLSNMLMQLRKLCNHPYVFGDEIIDSVNDTDMIGDDIWRTSGKFELLDRILPKFKMSGHRVLMFFQMTAIMDIMEQFLKHRGVKFLRLDGSTKSDDRSDLLKVFNAPNSDIFCFLLSTRAGGLGLNLQTADTVIIFDSDWNPHQDLQAQDRAHRIGQKNEVRILRLISSNSVEEKILERAQFKLSMDGKVIQAGKFDNKSTNEEREAMLRVMIETVENMDNMEQDEQDDDELNHIMARSDEELVMFKDMDEERERTSEYGPGKPLPRLMGDDELPEIYLAEADPTIQELEEDIGRGQRKRTQVKYDDGLTEEQWLEAVDNDDDTIEAAIERKEAKKNRRQSNKQKRVGGDSAADDDSPPPSRENSEPPSSSKKRSKKPGKSEKRKAEDILVDEPSSKKRKAQSKKSVGSEPVNDQDRVVLQKIMLDTHEMLMKLDVDVEGEDEPQKIIGPFTKVVPKSQFPDYHAVIARPIAMDIIKRKIKKEEYATLRDFWEDIKLMCSNCRQYNEDGSQLYKDAELIEESALEKLKEETAQHPEFADFEDENSLGLEASTRTASTAGTPLASGVGSIHPTSQPNGTSHEAAPPVGASKLKLTFKGAQFNGGGDGSGSAGGSANGGAE